MVGDLQSKKKKPVAGFVAKQSIPKSSGSMKRGNTHVVYR
jgi:hypothetical protein